MNEQERNKDTERAFTAAMNRRELDRLGWWFAEGLIRLVEKIPI